MTAPVVVIGYGNTLRGDDAVGPLIAETIAAWELTDIRVAAVHQLTPDLADVIASARLVVFVDASATETEVQTRSLQPSCSLTGGGHICDPGWLLGLTAAVHGGAPQAVLITVPGTRFDFGAELSRIAKAGMETALEQIAAMLE